MEKSSKWINCVPDNPRVLTDILLCAKTCSGWSPSQHPVSPLLPHFSQSERDYGILVPQTAQCRASRRTLTCTEDGNWGPFYHHLPFPHTQTFSVEQLHSGKPGLFHKGGLRPPSFTRWRQSAAIFFWHKSFKGQAGLSKATYRNHLDSFFLVPSSSSLPWHHFPWPSSRLTTPTLIPPLTVLSDSENLSCDFDFS